MAHNTDNGHLYAICQIRSNNYLGRYNSGYYGANSDPKPLSVLVLAYNYLGGERDWFQILGYPDKDLTYRSSGVYRGNLVISGESYSGKYSVNIEASFYNIETETGYIKAQQVIGGSKDLNLYDMALNHTGILLFLRFRGLFVVFIK